MNPILNRPPPAPRSHPVKPGAQAPGVGKGTTASGQPTGAPRATGRDKARCTTRGHKTRQRGTPPATTKAHAQVPSSNGRRVRQTRRAHTTRNEQRHEDRCQATPAAIQTDVCAPRSEPSPCRLRTPAVRSDKCVPEITQPLPATNSRRPDGQVCTPQQCPAHATNSTTHGASTPVNRSREAQVVFGMTLFLPK